MRLTSSDVWRVLVNHLQQKGVVGLAKLTLFQATPRPLCQLGQVFLAGFLIDTLFVLSCSNLAQQRPRALILSFFDSVLDELRSASPIGSCLSLPSSTISS